MAKGGGRGKLWERQLIGSAREQFPNGFVRRWPDAGFNQASGSFGSARTPADILIHSSELDALVECKAVNNTSIPFDRLAPHQEQALLEYSASAPCSVGLVCVLFYGKQRRAGFAIPVEKWCWYRDEIHFDRKSLPLTTLNDSSLRMPWLGSGLWQFPTVVLRGTVQCDPYL